MRLPASILFFSFFAFFTQVLIQGRISGTCSPLQQHILHASTQPIWYHVFDWNRMAVFDSFKQVQHVCS